MSVDCSLRSLTSPASNELLESHNSLTFKLLKTVADFSQALANLHDRFGHELQMLVETFRKRNGELRKEKLHCPNSLFQIWELFLQQVEVNSQQHGDISRDFSQTIGQGLIERVFHRKIQSKKIFAHRDRIETILLKSNELLLKCYNDYCQAYALALTNPARYMSEYIASHNVYVHQLQATNGMIHAYQTKALPRLLEDLEECHLDTSGSISSSMLSSSELASEKSAEQSAGYQSIAGACRQANHRQDLAQFVKVAATNPSSLNHKHNHSDPTSATSDHESGTDKSSAVLRYHQFQAPNLQNSQYSSQQIDPKNMQLVPTFKNEIAPDLTQPPAQQQPQLEKDRESLEERIEKFEERIETLNKLLVRSSESRLHNKVNELQEELCQKRYDLYVAQIHLSAVRSQLQLFEYNYRPSAAAVAELSASAGGAGLVGVDQRGGTGAGQLGVAGGGAATGGGSAGAGAYRNKWIKALKSLKESPSSSSVAGASTPLAAVGVGVESNRLADDSQRPELADSAQGQLGQPAQLQQQQQQQQQIDNQHCFQEYTFKKIASCDVCKEFLRGHMRQGVKCKLCKISAHNECQSKAHATIKCQQPKIKLLRRQKSAGELEVNNLDNAENSEPSERALASSKPDSIYQLLRQVLDAKKKGNHSNQQQQQQQHQQQQLYPNYDMAADYHLRVNYATGAMSNGQLVNLSSGNLALANQNGKSVSTSALGSVNASVDRWSVVMDLLAQSRAKTDETESGSSSAGKRHSKQLDKFKSAARSAAAASKHQRHYQQQVSQQQQQQQQQPTGLDSGAQRDQQQLMATSSTPLASIGAHQQLYQPQVSVGHLGPMGQQQSGPSQQQQQQQPVDSKASGGGSYLSGGLLTSGVQPQPLLIHHTKSLPVGQAQMAPSLGGFGHQQQPLPQPLPQPPMANQQSQQHRTAQHQQQMPYQLLNIGAQQTPLSTSAPHSPQRKRFNLRMKSFSLDSPESPSVVGVAAANSGSAIGYTGSGGSGGVLDQVGVGMSPMVHHQQHAASMVMMGGGGGGGQHPQQRHHHYEQLHYGPSQQEPQASGYGHSQQQAQAQQYSLYRHQHYAADNDYDLNPDASPRSRQQQQQQQQQQQTPNAIPTISTGKPQVSGLMQQQHQQKQPSSSSATFVVLYDYLAQRSDEIQLNAGQLVSVLDASERDWWKVRPIDGPARANIGYFPSTYLTRLYHNERPLQVAQTIQVSNGDNCNKLLRGQIVIHTGKQIDNFVTIRIVTGDSLDADHYIECPEKYLAEVEVERELYS